MENLTFFVVDALATLTVIGDILIALLLIAFIPRFNKIHTFVNKYALGLLFIVALTATSGSLFFSEIAGWTPCKDCWLQRIFMYPQVILLGIALWKKDRNIALYTLVLCIFGAILSADHYGDQMEAMFFSSPTDVIEPCDATGVSCSETTVFSYGYITIPMMALTAFILNAIGSIIVLRSKK